ncbi:hypothetical protein OAO01_00490 [Oligoflexia bacterium]|nr:hypothetical protein [Oligoflexia bacterium]
MERVCKVSGETFELAAADLELLGRVAPRFGSNVYEIPPPRLSPSERCRRRMAFRNERKFYARKCDRTGKSIISMFSPDKPYQVYSHEAWWNGDWDGITFGREFDFSRSFSEQFGELLLTVPKQANFVVNCENCDYNNYFRLLATMKQSPVIIFQWRKSKRLRGISTGLTSNHHHPTYMAVSVVRSSLTTSKM